MVELEAPRVTPTVRAKSGAASSASVSVLTSNAKILPRINIPQIVTRIDDSSAEIPLAALDLTHITRTQLFHPFPLLSDSPARQVRVGYSKVE